ncbi:MAG: hypothetical protein GW856_02920 [Cyanobacteria bacterium]|nr:hypothetical protein [Cyanobacteria bacterium CG_2015-16_32_12]NCO78305.1 hypothetical protein [Cyanobacteria bacterium CG_2015-22_32_23]NCS84523.1 hypothetical protein [Cyanobacteria bacterium CG_2015-02_32_10]
MNKVLIDLNNPIFQKHLFNLSKSDLVAVFKTLKKISNLTWEQLYQDQGLKWEMIKNKKGKNKESLYTLRITQKCRSIAVREGDYLRLLSLHTDHDSAYK